MRLLYRDKASNILTFTDYLRPGDIPSYAILSHTWGKPQDEVTYLDIAECRVGFTTKPGYHKLEFCLEQAERDGLHYVWIDTCCIDKRDYTELSREIHSMYRWYLNSKKCYVYLADISTRKRNHHGELRPIANSEIAGSRWFTRGWTLQELLAPTSVEFFSHSREYLGTRQDLASVIAARTGIAEDVLMGTAPVARHTRKARLSWIANRRTTYPEDKAYCLIGLLEVSMTLTPGETEEQSMRRLRRAMIEACQDDIEVDANTQGRRVANPHLHAPDRLDNSADITQSDRRKAFLDALKFEGMHSRRRQAKKPYSTTCAWLPDHPVYKRWLDSNEYKQHHGLLWVKGKPGAGKTTLVKYADDVACPKNIVRVGFYFHARSREILQKSIDGMYRSLLYQLLDKQTALQNLVLDTFDTSINLDASAEWPRETLQEMLAFVFANMAKRRIHCYIDALDECDVQQVQHMIDLFETINQDSADDKRYLRILLASRHYPIIRIRTDLELDLDKVPEHLTDIEQYVEGKLDTGSDPSVDIKQQLVDKAKGIFMWAVLVVDILNEEYSHGAIFNVRRRLEELQPGLSELFEELIKRDAGKNLDRFKRCLQWLLYAKRPLSCKEFYWAMALHEVKDDTTSPIAHEPTEEHMKRLVSSSSKGLAEISTDGTAIVQFIHESVRDYLIKDGGLQHIFQQSAHQDFFEATGQGELATFCLEYLQTNFLKWVRPKSGGRMTALDFVKHLRDELTTAYPLLDYTVNCIMHHANCATNNASQELFIESFSPFMNRWRQLSNLFEKFLTRCQPEDAHLLRLCAARNADRLIRLVIASGTHSYDAPILSSALYIALSNGHTASVRAILEWYKINLPDNILSELPTSVTYSPRHDLSPFLWALDRKPSFAYILLQSEAFISHLRLADLSQDDRAVAVHGIDIRDAAMSEVLFATATLDDTELLGLLLDDGASLSARGRNGDTLLMRAARRKHAKAVRFLIDRGADVNEIGDDGNAVLHRWFSNQDMRYGKDHPGLPRELLTKHVHINRPGPMGCTALIRALDCDFLPGNVSLLLAHGADVDAMDDSGQTALHYAAKAPASDCLEILLQHNADIHAVDKKGQTVLMRAAMTVRQSDGCVKLLLEQNADVHAIDMEGRTALIHAAMAAQGIEHCLETLLRHKADVHATDNYGRTALMYIHPYHNSEVLELLLQHNADINATDNKGLTALMHALRQELINPTLEYWCAEYLELLLQHNADVNAIDNQGQTALMYGPLASEKCIKVLLKHGAQINGRDPAGKTPLMLAVDEYEKYDRRLESLMTRRKWLRRISTLFKCGADALAVDNDGSSALMRAQNSRWSELHEIFTLDSHSHSPQ